MNEAPSTGLNVKKGGQYKIQALMKPPEKYGNQKRQGIHQEHNPTHWRQPKSILDPPQRL